MPQEHVIRVDPFKPLKEEPRTGHNRWHEAIEPVVEAEVGDTVVYETRDAFDGQLNTGSTDAEVEQLNLNPVHPLTGPVYVNGVEPGDLLEIELVAIEADPWEQWGYTIQVPGFGFLRDEFPEPFMVHWRLHGNEYAESEQLPGVRIRCNPRHRKGGGTGRTRRIRPAAGTGGRRAGRRAHRRRGAAHYPAARDCRKHRYQADLPRGHRSDASIRRGRTRLYRRCALCSGRLRGLRNGY